MPYGFCRKITIAHGLVGSGGVSNFPVCIDAALAYLATVANGGNVQNANGYDIIFTSDSAGLTALPYEREQYNAVNGSFTVWINIPSLSSTADTIIYMWYGNSAITTDQSNRTGAWDANFVGVYHCGNPSNTTGIGADSTSNANTLTLKGTGVAASSGVVYGAVAVGAGGGNGYMENLAASGLPTGAGPMTLECWFYEPSSVRYGEICGIGENVTNHRFAIYQPTATSVQSEIVGGGGPPVAIGLNGWHHIAIVMPTGQTNINQILLYLDGSPTAENSTNATLGVAGAYICIGAIPNTSGAASSGGFVDETRVSTTDRSQAWVTTTYNSIANKGTFLSIGGVISPDLGYPVGAATNEDLTPPWRRRTQESHLYSALPSFLPPQQVNLFGGGFTRRAFGIPSITGVGQPISAFVGGVDVGLYGMSLTATINRQLGTTGTLDMHFSMPTGGPVPVIGDSIVLTEFGKRIFSGYIDETDITIYPGTTLLDIEVKAVDWNATMQRRVVQNASFDAGESLLTVITWLNTFVLAGEGFTVGPIDPTIVVVDAMVFSYIKLSDALNQLALETDTIWWVDLYQTIQMRTFAGLASSAFAVDGSKQVDPSDMSGTGSAPSTYFNMRSLANYRNKQYVKATSNILSTDVTLTESHTFTQTRHPDPINGPLGIDSILPTSYPFAAQPSSLKENGVELIGTNRFFQLLPGGATLFPPPGVTGYYWIEGGSNIYFWPTYENGPLGTTVEVTYTGLDATAGNVVVYADAAEIAAMAAAMGTTGIFEEVEQFSGTGTYAELLALAQGIVEATAPVPNQFTVSTIEHIEDIGLLVAVSVAAFGLAEDMAIQQIQATHMGNSDLGKGSTFRTTLTLVSAKTLGDWRSWFERLIAKIQASAAVPPQERLSWQLAFDSPGNLSSGLSAGTFGAPLTVSSDQGQIAYLSIIFATAPDQDIIIDILQNGTSIFGANPKPSYTPGDTGDVEYYVNFSPSPLNVVKGDQFTLSVLQTGLIHLGKNGTVILVINQE